MAAFISSAIGSGGFGADLEAGAGGLLDVGGAGPGGCDAVPLVLVVQKFALSSSLGLEAVLVGRGDSGLENAFHDIS